MVGAEASLRDVGIHLPQASTRFAVYVEGVQFGNLLLLGGYAPRREPEAKIRWAHWQVTGRRGGRYAARASWPKADRIDRLSK